MSALVLSTALVHGLWLEHGVLWAATAGGVEAWTVEGRQAWIASGLPRADSRAVGRVRGRLMAGTAGGAAWQDGGEWSLISEERTVAVLPQGVLSVTGRLLLPGVGVDVSLQPPGMEEIFTDAVEWDGVVVAGTLSGAVLVYGDVLTRHELPAPVLDLAVGPDGVRIAFGIGAATLDADGLTELSVPATAASATAWGTADGELHDGAGRIARLPAPVTALEDMPDGQHAVGTAEGLYAVGSGQRRLTPDGQICGNFITGLTRWQGRLVASTFDEGACVLEEHGWRALEGLPSTMINAALADGERLYLASSEGLVVLDGAENVEVIGIAPDPAPRHAPGLHSRSVTGLAQGDRLWITDLAGPISVDDAGRWRRYRYHVWSTSSQRVAACGEEAWVATEDAGVSWFDGQRWQHFDALTGLPDDWIMAVACAGPVGFVGTYQDGVWRRSGGRWEELAGLPEPWVLSLAVDGDVLWVGTMNGLYRWRDGQWSAGPALPDPRVHVIRVEEDGLWVGTEGGLVWIDQALLEA